MIKDVLNTIVNKTSEFTEINIDFPSNMEALIKARNALVDQAETFYMRALGYLGIAEKSLKIDNDEIMKAFALECVWSASSLYNQYVDIMDPLLIGWDDDELSYNEELLRIQFESLRDSVLKVAKE